MSETTTGRRRPVPADLFGGRLAGCFRLDLEVVAVTELSARLRSLTFASPDLVGFEWAPGQDVMFTVPEASPVARRRYTIRRADAVAGTIDVEVVLHGDGPFARWATSATMGTRIDGIGPRGAQQLRADAAHHVFVGDETAALVDAGRDGTAAYVNGERALVRRAVAALVDAGVDPDRMQSKSYWRDDQPNAPHGEPAHD